MRVRSMLAAVPLLFAACSASDDVPAAEAAVGAFHRDVDRGAAGPIYDAASADMKAAAPRATLVQLLGAVHRKLGAFRSGKTTGWNSNYTTGGHFVTLNYDAVYERGTAVETFVYRFDGKRPLLAGYNVNSAAMMIN